MDAVELLSVMRRMKHTAGETSNVLYIDFHGKTEEDIVKVVEEWAKEHPIMTNAMKYKEVFGCEPKDNGNKYICPPQKYDICFEEPGCEKCRNWWDEEYKEPESEEK